MPSLTTRALMLYSRAVIKSTPESKQQLVRHLRRTMNNSPLPVFLPKSIRAHRFFASADTRDGQTFPAVQGDWLQVKTARRAILYLHGGGYIAGITKTYHNLCGHLARELDADVYLPEYRLAPEHPFPAAVEDAVTAYSMLLTHGWSGNHITLAGDSAGGGLALATLLKLRDMNMPLPACAVTLSPFADMTATARSHARNDATDAMLSASMLTVAEDLYVRDEADLRHPYASPVHGDFTGLPPLFITVSENECLRDDAHEVTAQARKAGVEVTLLARPDLLHVWPVFYPVLPEAREDAVKIINFVRATSGSRVGACRQSVA